MNITIEYPDTINKIQALNLELIKKASFNEFNGEEVVSDLLKYRDLWEGVIMGRFGGYSDLIPLRDIASNSWNIDEMYIIATGRDNDKLRLLAETWRADEVGFLTQKEAAELLGEWPTKKQLMRIWWD